jgi:hypothetical protein
MVGTRFLALALVAASGATVASAQDGPSPLDRGSELRARLAKSGPDARLVGEQRLSVHVGLARVGFLVLKTEVIDRPDGKVYRIEDRLEADVRALGGLLRMEVTGELGPDLSIRSVGLETETTGGGKVDRRRVDIVLDGGKLVATETREGAEPKRWTLDVPAGVVPLAPPVGAGERAARLAALAADESTLALPALDLETLERTTLRLERGKEAATDVRGAAVSAIPVARREAAAEVEQWITATGEVLKLGRHDRPARLVFVGREPRETTPSLPSPRGDDDAATTVLELLRASGRGDRPAVEAALDLDALWARARGSADEGLAKTFKKVVVDRLVSDEWRNATKLAIAGTMREDLDVKQDGDRATVWARSAPALRFEVARKDSAWRVVGLPER